MNRGGFGGFPGGGGGNMQALMKQAQKMQTDLQKAKEEAENTVVEGSGGGGAVKISMNGKYQVTSVSISKDAAGDAEMLQDLVQVACNDASAKIAEVFKNNMTKVTGGMNIPGLF
jgi:DNA-binding YbaB/EbfC family protein